jgi:hypothetical protein
MKKMLLAASSVLALVMLCAGPVSAAAPAAIAPISAAAGQPAMDRDVDFGYYIWVDGDRIQLRTTDRGNGPSPSEYTGTVTANGEMRDVNLIRQENDDWAAAAGNKLDFRFRTFNAIDGVAFTAHNATRITFRLYRDGHLVNTDHIYLGAGQINPPGNPFTLFV